MRRGETSRGAFVSHTPSAFFNLSFLFLTLSFRWSQNGCGSCRRQVQASPNANTDQSSCKGKETYLRSMLRRCLREDVFENLCCHVPCSPQLSNLCSHFAENSIFPVVTLDACRNTICLIIAHVVIAVLDVKAERRALCNRAALIFLSQTEYLIGPCGITTRWILTYCDNVLSIDSSERPSAHS
jgi:hypothetical protein